MGYARKDVEKTKKMAKKFVRYQDICGTLDGVDGDLNEFFGGHLMVDKGGHQQAVNYGYRRRFSGCKNAGIDPAQDDNGHQQCPNGPLRG